MWGWLAIKWQRDPGADFRLQRQEQACVGGKAGAAIFRGRALATSLGTLLLPVCSQADTLPAGPHWAFYFCRALGCSQDTECLLKLQERTMSGICPWPSGTLRSPRPARAQARRWETQAPGGAARFFLR